MVTRARKIYFTLLAVLWLATGCSFDSGRVQLLNWNWFGTPDKVTVQRGDTLYSISKRYNVPLRDLIEINNLTPPYTLIIGRQLRLPTAKFHTVAKGDTLYNISKRYGVDVTTLSRVNHLQAPYTLSIGQRLALPGSVSGGEVHTPAPVKTAKKSSGFSFWKSTVEMSQSLQDKIIQCIRSQGVDEYNAEMFVISYTNRKDYNDSADFMLARVRRHIQSALRSRQYGIISSDIRRRNSLPETTAGER